MKVQALNAITTFNSWEKDPLLTEGDAPQWKVEQFARLRNTMGAIVVVFELLASLLELHPLWHFISLLPLLIAGVCALLGYLRH